MPSDKEDSAEWRAPPRLTPSRRAFLESALTELIDAAIAISGANFGNVQLLDPLTSDLTIAAQRGFPSWWLDFWDRVSRGQGARGTALELGERVIVEDVMESPLFVGSPALDIQRRAGVRAVQSTPLLSRAARPLGVFSTYYRAPYRPDERSLQLLDVLARHASDIIERALSDQALAESEEKYATVFQLSPFAVALTKMPEGVLADVNDAFLQLFEYEREEVIGRTALELGIVSRSDRERFRAELEARGSVRGFECDRFTRSGSRRKLSLHANRVAIGGEPYVLTKAFDVTERYEGELQRSRLTEQLAELNRDLEQRVVERTEELRRAQESAEAASLAKSEFLSSMSHEIRTPLNSILGFAQLLRRDKKTPLTAHQVSKVDQVLKAGEHLLHLIDDVLDLSRIEAGRLTVSPEPVGVADVLAEVKATLGPIASEMEIDLAVETPHLETRVTADRTRFSQILINYGSNALKYGKRGGHATLAVLELEDSFVRVAVSDDGIGIPEHKQAKIFDAFERAGQETGPIEGTGIGLTITKRLAELMGGRVGFQSAYGRGSTFWIDLPARRAEPHRAEKSGSGGAPPSTRIQNPAKRQRTIVYVEDNPSNVALMESIIEELEQFALISVPSAEVGIELIVERRPDVVIMDVNLPGMSGYEATLWLHQHPETEHIPVIALTAAVMTEQRERARTSGFHRYLTKPLDVTELVEALEALPA